MSRSEQLGCEGSQAPAQGAVSDDFDAWFDARYPDRDDRQSEYRMTSVRELMREAWGIAFGAGCVHGAEAAQPQGAASLFDVADDRAEVAKVLRRVSRAIDVSTDDRTILCHAASMIEIDGQQGAVEAVQQYARAEAALHMLEVPTPEMLAAFQRGFMAQLKRRKHYKKGWEMSAEQAGIVELLKEVLAKVDATEGLTAPPAAPATDIDEAQIKRMTERGAVAWAGHEAPAAPVSDEQIIRAAVAAMPHCNPLVAEDLIGGHTMHTEAGDIVAIWRAASGPLRPAPTAPEQVANSRDCPYCNYTGNMHCGDVVETLKAGVCDPKDCSHTKVYGMRRVAPLSDEQAAFEAWASSCWHDTSMYQGLYKSVQTHALWCAWETRAILSLRPAPAQPMSDEQIDAAIFEAERKDGDCDPRDFERGVRAAEAHHFGITAQAGEAS